MFELNGTVVLVTGGAAGIGAGIVEAFLKEGAKHVAALDIDVTNGTALEKELAKKYGPEKVKFYKCDVASSDLDDAYDSVLKEFGYIDVVINNAALMNDDPKMYLKAIQVNVSALITSSFKAYNIMRKDHGGKGGTIVNISSMVALMRTPILPVYAATKSAVLQFTNCLGMEPHYPRSGVRVLTVCFGTTDTPLFKMSKIGSFDKETTDMLVEGITNMNSNDEFPVQTTESAVKGLMESYKSGTSGSTWLVTSDRPAEDISDNITKGLEIMGRGLTTPKEKT